MKKFIPFIFPAAAILIILILAFRWYSMRTSQTETPAPFAEGVEIENLTDTEENEVARGVGDYKSVEMSNSSENETDLGTIRYEIKDGKVRLSVLATLPELTDGGVYQVWFKEVNGEAIRKAFTLEMSKGGYIGSASISSEVLPFEVIVSKEMTQDDTLEETVLSGTVSE